ncbi:Major allergen Mal d 1 [Salvia divinorum]|uniref:Major allergen Mal d 1 n=1 Tax=Salvia divinorum TaxID=28513 RepID=A0ABD1GYE0_SALDI
MSTVTFTEEFSSTVAAARLFKALILDGDNLIPKIAPQALKNIEILEGNGGPGTIKKINLAEGSKFAYMKHRIDVLDEATMTYSYTLIEGDPLMDKLEKVTYETKMEASENGGATGKSGSTYYTKPGVEIKEEEIKAGKDKAVGLLKAVEAYLLANPEIYA